MCRGIVIRTGDFTMMASMAHITVVLQDSDVLLTDEITWWMHCLTSVAVSIACVLFVIAFIAGFHWLDAIILLIGITVAIVPEGLVAVVTVCTLLDVSFSCSVVLFFSVNNDCWYLLIWVEIRKNRVHL